MAMRPRRPRSDIIVVPGVRHAIIRTRCAIVGAPRVGARPPI